jgi:hypothetical protein
MLVLTPGPKCMPLKTTHYNKPRKDFEVGDKVADKSRNYRLVLAAVDEVVFGPSVARSGPVTLLANSFLAVHNPW